VLDRQIADLYVACDAQQTLAREVPGVASTIAAAIEAFVGDVERFDNIGAFAAMFGIVPRTHHTSGKTKAGQRLTKAGQAVLKQYLFLAAEVARRKDPELAATYQRFRAQGKTHNSAAIIVAHKLVRKIYAVLRRRAERHRDQAAGVAAEHLPVVEYLYRDPQTGQVISRQQAKAIIDARFPSKRQQLAAKRTARQTSPVSGSPKDAAKGIAAAPSQALPNSTPCGQSVDNLVTNVMTSLDKKMIDET